MAELFPMNLVNPVLHLLQQLQPAPRDSCDDVTPIVTAALPHNQLCVFETIEKTSNVRDLAHQSLRDFAPTKTCGLRTAQNPKNVVLRGRNAVRLQGGLKGVLEQRRGALDAEVRFLFQALEGPRLFQFCL
jgi:hypothetical protein